MNLDSDENDMDFMVMRDTYPDMPDFMVNNTIRDMKMGGITSMCPFIGCMPMVPEIMEDETDDESLRGEEYSTPEQVLRQIENKNPQIFRTMNMYGIPKNTARMIFKRIIKLTMTYK